MHHIKANWPAPTTIHAFTTTRQNGVSKGQYAYGNLATHVGDDEKLVKQNRKILLESLQLPQEPLWLNQTHSTIVVNAGTTAKNPTADASFTTEKNTVLAILTADCLPILLCDRNGTTVAAIHGGWRGLAADIISHTIKSMAIPSGQLIAWLGPAIGPIAFEVGEDVYTTFTKINASAATAFQQHQQNKWYADIYKIARIQLHQLGVTEIYGGDYCSYTQAEYFYSYRRDGQTGRMASIIWIS